MNNPDLLDRINAIKAKIEAFIEKGYIAEADSLLEQLYEKMPGDPEVCSMRAVTRIIEGKLDEAEAIVKEGLVRDSVHFDLLFNLGYIREQQGLYQEAADLYCKSETAASTSEQKQNVDIALKRLKSVNSEILYNNKPKIVFFVKKGMDSFLGDIIDNLEKSYWTRKIIVNDFKQIDKGMEWADICWFEWCDELVIYGTNLKIAGEKRIICRLHRYEVFTDNPGKVVWENVNKLIIVAAHLKQLLKINFPDIFERVEIEVIENGVNINKYIFKKRSKGFNLAMVGYIHARKNPFLILQIIKKLVSYDKRYKLYVAGEFQEQILQLYWDYQVTRMGLKEHVIFDGWQKDINTWLENKNYFVSASIHESFGYGIAEAMARGIKPIIHDFLFAHEVWNEEFLFNTVDEAVENILKGPYESEKYRAFIEDNYSLNKQLNKIRELICKLLSEKTVFDKVMDILNYKEKPQELLMDELTVLIPCYNRAQMLFNDIDMGLKLGNVPKLIVDDCSTEERDSLVVIEKKYKDQTRIIYKHENEGLAQSRWTGLQNINSAYTAFLDDDDMLFCTDGNEAIHDLDRLKNNYLLVLPRYVMNLTDKLSIGYDRVCYNDLTAAEVLRDIASKSEIMAMLAGGSIGVTNILKEYSLSREFKVAEDFVMLARMFAANPTMKIGLTESLTHIRRISNDTLSKTLSPFKMSLGLLAQCIACYYCLQLGIATKYEVLEWMKCRAALIQRLYNFGEMFETDLISYLQGESSEEVFINFLALLGFRQFCSLDELAPELPKMRNLFYYEPEPQNYLIETKDLPLVSIIIPTFNRKNMLKRAIDHALKQDYPNIEVIVSDNCSEDGTEEMIRDVYKDEVRLVYNRNSENIGANLNCKKGLYELSKGKYCLIHFDDDYFIDSTYISAAVELLENEPDTVYVFGGLFHNNMISGEVKKEVAKQPEIVDGTEYFINFKSEKYPIMPSMNTILFRREAAIKYKCLENPQYSVAGDMFMQLKLLLHGNAGFINRAVVVYNLHKGSMSKNLDNRPIDANDIEAGKAVLTASDDIKGLREIYELAMNSLQVKKDIIDNWLSNKIFNYLYWRFNETIQTVPEMNALLEFVRAEHPAFYATYKAFTEEKYGRNS